MHRPVSMSEREETIVVTTFDPIFIMRVFSAHTSQLLYNKHLILDSDFESEKAVTELIYLEHY